MRIVLADDHSIIRAALRAIVEAVAPQATVVDTASFDDLAAVLAADAAADLVILDLSMPGYQGPGQVAAIVQAVAPRPVAVFSMSEAAEDMRAMFEAGARAYIPKSTDHAVLEGILRIVLAGGVYVPPALALGGGPAAAWPGAGTASPAGNGSVIASLTPRQRDVMVLLAEGLSNNEICERMGLNLSTVKAHVSGILRALGADSRTQAALRIRQLLKTE
jgi:DNA-binding NarL/FixJ family response regulator